MPFGLFGRMESRKPLEPDANKAKRQAFALGKLKIVPRLFGHTCSV
jgi:hypothetical protein